MKSTSFIGCSPASAALMILHAVQGLILRMVPTHRYIKSPNQILGVPLDSPLELVSSTARLMQQMRGLQWMDTYMEWVLLYQEMIVMVEVDNNLLKELIETGRQIRKELDEFNENLDVLIEAVTVGECDWVDWERSKQTSKQRWTLLFVQRCYCRICIPSVCHITMITDDFHESHESIYTNKTFYWQNKYRFIFLQNRMCS